jgi:hypothetical protein
MHAVLEGVAAKIARELDGLDAETSQEYPNDDPRRWSIQQVIEHLVLTYRLTAKALEARLTKGRVTRDQSRTLLQRTLQLMVLSFGYIPQGAPAMEETVPLQGAFRAMTGVELSRLLNEELETMDAVLDRCRRKFGMERVAVHPILGPLRVDEWRRYNALHSAHHLKQIQQVRKLVAAHVFAKRSHRGALEPALTKELQIPAQRPFA